MYAAVPETVGQCGREPAAARDADNITNSVASHTPNTPAKIIASHHARHCVRSAAR
jgi:hypothetical protein